MARTGRPRGFSRPDAVGHAMNLFWAHGYEATSLTQLRAAMGGISSASFYAAFGSKEALFREAVELYVERHGTCLFPLSELGLPPRQALEQALRRSVDMQTEDGHPPGCLVCSSTVSCSPEAAEVQAFVATIRRGNHRAILACIERAVDAGALPDPSEAPALAATFNGFLIGISAQARDGVTRSAMQAAVSQVMRLWPPPAPPAAAAPAPE